jgi:2-dehydro-3-deoxyphosphooctonate aldolase (KDO 8-P synthase)
MAAQHIVSVGNIQCGSKTLFLISGPCVIETEEIMMKTAEFLKTFSEKHHIPVIYKSSFMKDNRSDLKYYHGPGIDKGMKILSKIREQFQLPILTDVHYPEQIPAVASVVDVIQIPAYLCMQSGLVVQAAKTGLPVNLKHGQFISPENMSKPVKKILDSGNDKILLTERGYTFGYNDLVVDPRSFYHLRETGFPVIFDITHSIRKYGIPSADPAGGSKQYLNTIARAGVAAGVDGLFIETHPDPANALCDAASQICIDDFEKFIIPLIEFHELEVKFRNN